jgi:hypothetical protein
VRNISDLTNAQVGDISTLTLRDFFFTNTPRATLTICKSYLMIKVLTGPLLLKGLLLDLNLLRVHAEVPIQ